MTFHGLVGLVIARSTTEGVLEFTLVNLNCKTVVGCFEVQILTFSKHTVGNRQNLPN